MKQFQSIKGWREPDVSSKTCAKSNSNQYKNELGRLARVCQTSPSCFLRRKNCSAQATGNNRELEAICIGDDILLVDIVKVGHRKDVYR